MIEPSQKEANGKRCEHCSYWEQYRKGSTKGLCANSVSVKLADATDENCDRFMLFEEPFEPICLQGKLRPPHITPPKLCP